MNNSKTLASKEKNTTSLTVVQAVDSSLEVAIRAMNVWGQAAGAVFERTGIFLAGCLDAFGEILTNIPGGGRILRKIFHWLGTMISAGFDLVAIIICSLTNLLADGSAGMVRVLTGVLGATLTRETWLIRKGAGDILAGSAGTVIAVLAKTVALIQAALFLQLGERALTEQEKALVRQVYRDSIAVQNIRIIVGFVGLFSVNTRPFVLGNRIYLKEIDTAKDPGLFAHECCHIWQFQRVGVRYIVEALWAQWKVANAYSWEAELARGHVRWQEFNREAQAQFLQDVFNDGRRKSPAHMPGEFYDDDPVGAEAEYQRKGLDYTDLARNTITFIRNKGVSGQRKAIP